VYQRLVNANFNLNVHRTALLSDFSALAVDASGADAFRAFQADLLALQTSLDASPAAPWRMEPNRLKANINA
jgi:arachidonate 15-lipoxygenase